MFDTHSMDEAITRRGKQSNPQKIVQSCHFKGSLMFFAFLCPFHPISGALREALLGDTGLRSCPRGAEQVGDATHPRYSRYSRYSQC